MWIPASLIYCNIHTYYNNSLVRTCLVSPAKWFIKIENQGFKGNRRNAKWRLKIRWNSTFTFFGRIIQYGIVFTCSRWRTQRIRLPWRWFVSSSCSELRIFLCILAFWGGEIIMEKKTFLETRDWEVSGKI